MRWSRAIFSCAPLLAMVTGAACGDDAKGLCAGDGSGCACAADDECAEGLYCYQERCLPDPSTDSGSTGSTQSSTQSSTGTSTGTATGTSTGTPTESFTGSSGSTTTSSTSESTTGPAIDTQTICRDLNEPIEPNVSAGFEDTIELPSGMTIDAVRVELVVRTPNTWGVTASIAGAQRITSLYDGDDCPKAADIVATFDADSVMELPEGCGDDYGISGTLRPDGDLGIFVGHDLGGPWTLRVRDIKATGDAVIERWCLHVDVTPGGTPNDPSQADAMWTRPKSLGDVGRRIYSSWGYDPERDVVVGFGGCTAIAILGVCSSTNKKMTVEWDGDTWKHIDTVDRPGGNNVFGYHSGAMAYDPVEGALLLFGGYALPGGYTTNAETWTYNGAEWTKRLPAMSPSARAEHTLVWDPVGAQIILYGGHNPGGMPKVLSDVWAWDGDVWSPMPSEGGPGPLHTHAATWHSGLARMIVFGGFAGEGYPQKEKNPHLWSYNPADGQWKQHADAPVGVGYPQIAYDDIRDRLIMFGGIQGPLEDPPHETFEWDGAEWFTLTRPVWEPVPRHGHGMVWMSSHQVAFLYGGRYSLAANDTWYYARIP